MSYILHIHITFNKTYYRIKRMPTCSLTGLFYGTLLLSKIKLKYNRYMYDKNMFGLPFRSLGILLGLVLCQFL